MTKIIAPNKLYNGISATVKFINGEGHTDDPTLIEWFEQKGYEVEKPKKKSTKPKDKPEDEPEE